MSNEIKEIKKKKRDDNNNSPVHQNIKREFLTKGTIGVE